MRAAVGAGLFFGVAPGFVAGVVPYLLTGWRRFEAGPALVSFGAAMIVVGVASLVESFLRFVVSGGTPAPVAPPNELVVSGQYRFVRNPMYVAVVGIIAGQALILGRAILLGYAAVAWALFHLWVLAYEEPNLRRRFGATYQAYCSGVGRWLPRTTPWAGA